jgi:hypothetical protein
MPGASPQPELNDNWTKVSYRRDRSTHKPTSSANQRYTWLKRYDEKPFSANENYAAPPHSLTGVLTELK